mmetsp:Transcript_85268/g.260680  ORF Transcript_85268/g.260680 Transcript_85268/m.260680 type:complete len:202 (+) Transcript_85268:339-944(+)
MSTSLKLFSMSARSSSSSASVSITSSTLSDPPSSWSKHRKARTSAAWFLMYISFSKVAATNSEKSITPLPSASTDRIIWFTRSTSTPAIAVTARSNSCLVSRPSPFKSKPWNSSSRPLMSLDSSWYATASMAHRRKRWWVWKLMSRSTVSTRMRSIRTTPRDLIHGWCRAFSSGIRFAGSTSSKWRIKCFAGLLIPAHTCR